MNSIREMRSSQSTINNFMNIIKCMSQYRGQQQFEDHNLNMLYNLICCAKQNMNFQKEQMIFNILENGIEILSPIQLMILDSKVEIRASVIKIFRYILCKETTEYFLKSNTYIFIGHCLERDRSNQDQTQMKLQEDQLECIKFIKLWIKQSAQNFPKFLANMLVALTQSQDKLLIKSSIDLLIELVLENPLICAWAGGIRVLIDSIIDPELSDKSESIVLTFLFLLKDNNLRDQIHSHLDFSRLFSIFTDVEQNQSQENQNKKKLQSQNYDLILQLEFQWLYFPWFQIFNIGNEQLSLKSLVIALKQPIDCKNRGIIFEIIGEIFAIGIKQPFENQNNDQLKIQDLLNQYLIIIIQLLLEFGLYKILLELSGLNDPEISTQAQKYLKQLSFLIHNLFPKNADYSKFLMLAASQNDNFYIGRSNVTHIINMMGNYLFENENDEFQFNNSQFFYQCETLHMSTPLTLPKYNLNNEAIIKLKIQIETVIYFKKKDVSDTKFRNLLSQSCVIQNKNPNQWNWDTIYEIINTCLMNSKPKLVEAINQRFIRRVLSFYRPSKSEFIQLDWVPDNFHYIKTGYSLIKLLLKYSEGRNELISSNAGVLKVQESFIIEISNLFNIEFKKLDDQQIFCSKMIREYVTFIGLISNTQKGISLLVDCLIFESLNKMITRDGKYDHVLTLMIFSLDYSKDNHSRTFLKDCLQNGSKTLIQAGIQLIDLLFRNELSDFTKWGIELLFSILENDQDIQVQVLDIIEDIAIDPEYTEFFIKYFETIYKLGQKSQRFFLKMLSNEKALDYLMKLDNFILNQLDYWKNEGNIEYCSQIDESIQLSFKNVNNDNNSQQYNIPKLLVNQECSYLSLGFIYRLPWFICANFEDQMSNSFHSYNDCIQLKTSVKIENQKIIILGNLIENQNTAFKKNSQFKISIQLYIGRSFIDNNCRKCEQSQDIICDYKDKKVYEKYRNGYLIIEKDASTFIFQILPDEMLILSEVRIVFNMSGNKKGFEQVPLHICGQIAKTQKGIDLLKEINYIGSFIEDIIDPNTDQKLKQASLQAMGHLGRTEYGIKLIIEKNAIKNLVKLNLSFEILSQRKSYLQVMNMLAQTQQGRKELESEGWVSHITSLNSYMILPKKLTQILTIKVDQNKIKLSYWPTQEQYWTEFDNIIKKLIETEEQNTFFTNFQKLTNSLLSSQAQKELRVLTKSNSEICTNLKMFYAVILLMTFFKFTVKDRKFIYQFFDKLLQPQNKFISDIDKEEIFQKTII